MTETKAQQPLRVCKARIYCDPDGGWFAEVWARTDQPGPPRASKPILRQPPPVPGMDRVGVAFKFTRWGARRAARRMKARYEHGLPCDPRDVPTVETIR
jgi:hypothetical protein